MCVTSSIRFFFSVFLSFYLSQGVDSCIFALDSEAAKGNSVSEARYKMFLFDDMAEYIANFVSPLYLGRLPPSPSFPHTNYTN